MKGEGWRVGRGQPGVFGTGKFRPCPHDGADHSRVKQGGVDKDEPRMNTNWHEYEWISFSFSSWPIGNQDPVRLIRLSTD